MQTLPRLGVPRTYIIFKYIIYIYVKRIIAGLAIPQPSVDFLYLFNFSTLLLFFPRSTNFLVYYYCNFFTHAGALSPGRRRIVI